MQISTSSCESPHLLACRQLMSVQGQHMDCRATICFTHCVHISAATAAGSEWEQDLYLQLDIQQHGRWNGVAFWMEVSMGFGRLIACTVT